MTERLNLSNANTLGNYAHFLNYTRHDADAAQTYYEQAIGADPTNAWYLGAYANLSRSNDDQKARLQAPGHVAHDRRKLAKNGLSKSGGLREDLNARIGLRPGRHLTDGACAPRMTP